MKSSLPIEQNMTMRRSKMLFVPFEVYGAKDVQVSQQAQSKLDQFSHWGCSSLPICVAKTQYSLSDDPKLTGAPIAWTLHVTDAFISAGARFVVAVAGNMMLMPGLPKSPHAMWVDVDDFGQVLNL